MAVIKDVAKAAGVSVSAVSKYFRIPEQMRPATVEKIQRAIAQLNYEPSPLARSLRTGKTGTIAVVVPQIDNPFFSNIFETIHNLCVGRGFFPTLHKISTAKEKEMTLRMLNAKRVDGAIYYDEEEPGGELPMHQFDIPVVQIRFHHNADLPNSVSVDLSRGMTQLCEHLVAMGVKRAAYIGESPDMASSAEKLSAAKSVFQRHGVDMEDVLLGRVGYEGGYEASGRLLEKGRVPDALISETDLLAVGAMKRLHKAGVRIPEDLCVTGFDDTTLARMVEPELTSVRIPVQEMCEQAFLLLGDMMEKKDEGRRHVLTTSLVVRESSRRVYKA